MRSRNWIWLILLLLAGLSGAASNLQGEDVVTFSANDRPFGAPPFLSGRVASKAEDGGLLFEEPSSRYWLIEPQMIASHESNNTPFRYWDAEATEDALKREFPGFKTHKTEHYVVVYSASEAYARWCGSLFERLHEAFHGYWRAKGWELQPSRSPLVVVIFGDRGAYAKHAEKELGPSAGSIVGYFHLQSNRVTMQDLTGNQKGRNGARGSRAEITAMLRSPEALLNVATVVHEATHQTAYNSGLHQRLADIPLWVSEGIAMYFETPDVDSPRGWRKIDLVNAPRLADFRKQVASRPADSLQLLMADDRRFRDPKQGVAAYAEAWALNYFLLKMHPKEYVKYLRHLSKKSPLVWATPEERIREFETETGLSLPRLDHEMTRYFDRLN